MKKGSVKKLQVGVLILQGVALVIVGLLTLFQTSLKPIVAPDMEEWFAIPLGCFVEMTVQLILYAVAFLVFAKTEVKGTWIKAGVLVGVLYMVQLVLSGADTVIMRFIAYQGVNAITNYAAMNSLVAMVASPIANLAVLLFCFTCGGYVGCTDGSAKVTEERFPYCQN